MNLRQRGLGESGQDGSRLAVPGVRSMFEVAGEGGEEIPREALAVEAIPSLRPVPRSSVQPCNTPSFTITRRAVGRPSPSKAARIR